MRFIYDRKKINISRDNFKKNDLKYLDLLEEDELFFYLLKYTRRTSLLPEQGINPNTSKDFELLNNSDLTMLFNIIIKIIYLYQLPMRWFVTFLSLAIFTIPVPPYDDNKFPIQTPYKNPDLSRITIIKEGKVIKEMSGKKGVNDSIIANELNKIYSKDYGYEAIPKIRKRFNKYLDKYIEKNRERRVVLAIASS